jgi:hypothetical protein
VEERRKVRGETAAVRGMATNVAGTVAISAAGSGVGIFWLARALAPWASELARVGQRADSAGQQARRRPDGRSQDLSAAPAARRSAGSVVPNMDG